jgi:hypothetical protein
MSLVEHGAEEPHKEAVSRIPRIEAKVAHGALSTLDRNVDRCFQLGKRDIGFGHGSLNIVRGGLVIG